VGFADVSYARGLASESRGLLSWSAHLFDADGDGWLDLFTTNGHVYPCADAPDTGTSYAQTDALWRLGPDPRARRVTAPSPSSWLATPSVSRGSALGDLDGDGAPDLVVVRLDGPAALLRNHFDDTSRLCVRCLGPKTPLAPEAGDAGAPDSTGGERRTPRDGHGARAVLVATGPAGPFAQTAEVQTSCGYQSASTPWLHFGLGDATRFDELRVLWPSGRVEVLPGGTAGRRLWLREGEGLVREEALP
jgi:enediyne biosynthesis protein E4